MTTQLTAAEGAALIGAPETISTVTVPGGGAPSRTTQDRETDIAERFKADTAEHEMTVLHEDGLYRHLRFMNPRTSEFWFELVTWPGSLTIRGDYGDAYTFSRLDDMFQFFRADHRWGINPHYWAEKLGRDGGRRTVKEYSEELFRQLVKESTADAIRYSDAPRGISRAVRDDVLSRFDLYDEEAAREALEEFEYDGFQFEDVWEWNFHDYRPEFLWACHAIRHGIAQYDAANATTKAAAS